MAMEHQSALDKRLVRAAETDLKKLPRVEVTWFDAKGDNTWQSFDDARAQKLGECKSLGWLVKIGKNVVTLAGSINDIGQLSDIVTIPKPWITKTVRVSVHGTPKRSR